MAFRIDQINGMVVMLSVLPSAKISSLRGCFKFGSHEYTSNGHYRAPKRASDDGRWWHVTQHEGYGAGDVVTICLNFDASTVTFSKNGKEVVSPHKIPRSDAYHFAFIALFKGDGVTILKDVIRQK